jgi:tRNA(Ile2) C34 agmatinyltransferase TiaS
MAGKDIIAMTQEELKRLHVIRKALDKSITQIEAAEGASSSKGALYSSKNGRLEAF